MKERQKMLAGKLYNSADPELSRQRSPLALPSGMEW